MTTSTWEFTAHPHMLRRQATVWAILMPAAALFGWFALPVNVRTLFTVPQVLTLLFFLAVMLGIVAVLSAGWIKAGPAGVRYRNGLRTHEVPWDQITGIRYWSADHWPFLELVGDEERALLGIMRSDGPLADQQVAEFRAVAARYLHPDGA